MTKLRTITTVSLAALALAACTPDLTPLGPPAAPAVTDEQNPTDPAPVDNTCVPGDTVECPDTGEQTDQGIPYTPELESPGGIGTDDLADPAATCEPSTTEECADTGETTPAGTPWNGAQEG